jgi:2-desacetyl-2-hydroxyethyl bacteriochlorophyllide A dehydrogenase
MIAAIVDGKGGIDIVERPVPVPGEGDVLIAPGATGVCGTDLHLIEGSYEHGRYPVVPGHEFAGRIVAVGRGVTGFREGDFVGVDPNISCGECRWCLSGAKNLCPTIFPVGINYDGSVAELVSVPASVTHHLSESLDAISGALVEPLSCVLHAVEMVPGWQDNRTVILGAGPIGLLAVAVAKQLGAASVEVVEPMQARRELAVRMGAQQAVADVSELATDIARDPNVDLVIDASGHPAAIQSGIDILGRRGRLCQMGVAHEDVTVSLSPYQVFAKEISIIGSQSLATAYPAAAEMMVDIADTLRPMVTDVLPLSQYAEAVRRAGSAESVKVQVVPD